MARPRTDSYAPAKQVLRDPFKGLSMRFTYRTARVLATIAACPGASNREVSEGADIADEGQTSRLLARLREAELIANDRSPDARGERNSWSLTGPGDPRDARRIAAVVERVEEALDAAMR